jgi:hypothetical protein
MADGPPFDGTVGRQRMFKLTRSPVLKTKFYLVVNLQSPTCHEQSFVVRTGLGGLKEFEEPAYHSQNQATI